MRVGNDLFLTCRSIDLLFVWVVAIELVFVCWPKITLFVVSIELDFVSAWVVEIETSLDFSGEIGIDLVFMYRSKLTCF